jgi:hypothetical protein
MHWEFMGYHGGAWASMENLSKTLGTQVLMALVGVAKPIWPSPRAISYGLNREAPSLRNVLVLFCQYWPEVKRIFWEIMPDGL